MVPEEEMALTTAVAWPPLVPVASAWPSTTGPPSVALALVVALAVPPLLEVAFVIALAPAPSALEVALDVPPELAVARALATPSSWPDAVALAVALTDVASAEALPPSAVAVAKESSMLPVAEASALPLLLAPAVA